MLRDHAVHDSFMYSVLKMCRNKFGFDLQTDGVNPKARNTRMLFAKYLTWLMWPFVEETVKNLSTDDQAHAKRFYEFMLLVVFAQCSMGRILGAEDMPKIPQEHRKRLIKMSHAATAEILLSGAFFKGFIVYNFIYSGSDEERVTLAIMEHVLCKFTNQLHKYEIKLE